MKHLLHSLALAGIAIFCTRAAAQDINAFAGNHTSGYSGDGGAATTAQCYAPAGVAADKLGNIYFCELGNSIIRKVSPSGIISTVAGTGTTGFGGDGGPATAAQISQPTSVAVDDTGNIYFTDDGNNRIRKVNTAGIVNTIAGTGIAGFSDNIDAKVGQLNGPSGIAVDKKGNVYIADVYNHAVRKIDTGGHLTTICGDGTSGYTGNGGDASIAKLNFPKGVCVDTAGYLFIVDQGNHAIRRINLSGIINTYAGNGTAGYSGNGGLANAASINTPTEVAVDRDRNLYIADYGNHVVRRVKPNGFISTVVGNGNPGYSGDGGRAIDAMMTGPYGVACNASNVLYVSDAINHVVRKVGVSVAEITEATSATLQLYPNPASDMVNINLPASITNARLAITDISGREVWNNNVAGATASVDVSKLQAGIYIVILSSGTDIRRSQLTVIK